ncbi:MAG TPA: PKD domain-containing protein [Longimicrobiales bacterium]
MLAYRQVLPALLVLSVACDAGTEPDGENDPPEAVIQAPLAGERGLPIGLDGSNSHDVNQDSLSHSWSFVTVPASSAAALQNAGSAQTSFVPDRTGAYTVQLTVSDGVAESTATHTITVDVLTLALFIVDSVIRNTTEPADQPDYRVQDSIGVFIYADVVIEPGVTVAMGEATSITVAEAGSIHAVGTEVAPIRFVGEVDQPGHWGALSVESDHPNELTFVEIANGGGNGFGALYLSGRLKLTHSTIESSAHHGLDVLAFSGASLPDFLDNEFRNVELGSVHLPADLVGALDTATDYAGEGDGVVLVHGATVATAQTWSALNAPISIDANQHVGIEAPLSIEAGSRFLMGAGSGIDVLESGSLSAIGTTSDSISFVGTSPVSGHWGGIAIYTSGPGNRLSHVHLAHAGGGSLGALYLEGTLQMDHTTVRNSGGYGLEAIMGAELPDFTSNTFTANAREGVRIPTSLIGSLDGSSTFVGGNNPDRISVSGGTSETSQTWGGTDAPFFLEPDRFIAVDSDVIIEDFQLRFGAGASFQVVPSGSLAVTASSFTGEQPTPGYWREFTIHTTSPVTMSNVQVSHGGGGTLGMIYVDDSSLTLSNSSVTHSADYGVEVGATSTYVATNVTYSNNALGNVFAH